MTKSGARSWLRSILTFFPLSVIEHGFAGWSIRVRGRVIETERNGREVEILRTFKVIRDPVTAKRFIKEHENVKGTNTG